MPASPRGGECAAQICLGGPRARQAHAAGAFPELSRKSVRRRELVGFCRKSHFRRGPCFLGPVRACRLAQFSRAAWYRPSRAQDQSVSRARIREIFLARPRFWFMRKWVVLRREGRLINMRQLCRLCCLEGLPVRPRVYRRKHMALHRGRAPLPARPIERLGVDCVRGAFRGRRRTGRTAAACSWTLFDQ